MVRFFKQCEQLVEGLPGVPWDHGALRRRKFSIPSASRVMCSQQRMHATNYLWLSRGAHYTLDRTGKERTATSVLLTSNASNFGMKLHVVVVSGDLAQGGVPELQRE
ncbi:hypothetical protein SVAN01_02587 [Stagonosporopsis vannaccii]|nr:hypothetical protein SVAN01_02587 [Stagonosporopsis vannaccii]